MREILFRGKRKDNGKWIEGYYFERKDTQGNIIESVILVDAYEQITSGQRYVRSNLNQECFRVDSRTIGQFTGLTDKNGTKIFEGDIVRDMGGTVYPVVFELTGFYLKYAPPHSHGFHFDLLPLSNYWHAHGSIIEVIGNIHDNPELLEVDNDSNS